MNKNIINSISIETIDAAFFKQVPNDYRKFSILNMEKLTIPVDILLKHNYLAVILS